MKQYLESEYTSSSFCNQYNSTIVVFSERTISLKSGSPITQMNEIKANQSKFTM